MLDGKNYILNTSNYYTTYFIDNNKHHTIVVSPGGGYQYTSPRESAPVAKAFNDLGYHVIVVNYRETVLDSYPLPGKYLAEVLAMARGDSRVDKIIGLGFSAGGHNILEVALHNNIYKEGSKPDLLILGYPVVTSDPRYSHKGSFENLLHENANDKELLDLLSLEHHVDSNAPDLFLWGTFTDHSVDVMNSLLLLEAYRNAGCNAEYHCFPMGEHGLSVATGEPCGDKPVPRLDYVACWVSYAGKWLNEKLNK